MNRLVPIAALLVLAAPVSPAQQAPDTSGAPPPSAQQTPQQAAELRAEILMARKDYAHAAQAYDDLLRLDPKNPALWNKQGIAYQELGEIGLAERCYKNALKHDSKFANAINNLGTIEYGRNRFGKAIKYYRRAVALGTNSAAVYGNLGYAYYANKQFPQAMDAFSKALALDPDAFSRKGGTGSIVQQMSTTEPGMLHFLLAKSFAKAGDAERAAHFLKMARDDGYKDYLSVKKDPDFAHIINDPRVQEVLKVQPPYEGAPPKPAPN